MACSKGIKSTFLSGYSSGGTLELIGYTTDGTSTPDPTGGNWPWTSSTNADPVVNFNNIESGYYHIKHFGGGASGDPCYGEIEFIIPVTQGGSAGIDATTTVCDSGAPIDVADELGVVFDPSAAIPPEFEWSGDATASPGWDEGAGVQPSDASFNPAVAGVGVYTLTLTVTPGDASGYSKEMTCSNCDETTATLTIIVEAEFNAGTAQNKAACNDGD